MMMGKKYIDQAALLADMESMMRSLERESPPEGAVSALYAAGDLEGVRMGMNYVGSREAVDAVEVVRCRECMYSASIVDAITHERNGLWCALLDLENVEEDFSCKDGQRREEVVDAEAMRAIDRHEAEFGADGRRAFGRYGEEG